jgi:hypothetical protein
MRRLHLPAAARAWNGPDFGAALKAELEALGAEALPLLNLMQRGSTVLDTPIQVMVLGTPGATADASAAVRVRVGVFFSSLLGGCSCADDPTPVEAEAEYGELDIHIDLQSGTAEARAADD